MKLIGSAVEETYRQGLKSGLDAFLNKNSNPYLYEILKNKVGHVSSVYFLSGYELGDYENGTILLNGDTIVYYEITDGELEKFEIHSLEKYKIGLKKHGMIKLLVALDLASSFHN